MKKLILFATLLFVAFNTTHSQNKFDITCDGYVNMGDVSALYDYVINGNDLIVTPSPDPVTPMSGTLKILAIGNSYSYDALVYLPSVMALAAPDLDLTVAIAMDGSQTLAGHLAKINNGTRYTRYSKLNIKTKNNDLWSCDYNANIDVVLADEQWDIIFFHEASNLSVNYASIEASLPGLMASLREKGYEGKFGYIITPSFAEGTTSKGQNKLAVASESAGLDHVMSSDEMSRRIVECAVKAHKDFNLDIILPCGLALQMARHTPLSRLGDWAPEDAAGGMLVYSDGHHLQMGIGNYIESCAAAIMLTDRALNLKQLTSNPHWANGDRMSRLDENGKWIYTGLDYYSQAIGIQCATIAAEQLIQQISAK